MAELIEYRDNIKQYEKDLRRVEGGLALAAAEMLNTVGGFAHAESAKNLRARFHLRNQYTEGSLRAYPVNYKKSNGQMRELNRMKFISATWSRYLPIQESGGTQHALAGAKHIPMPTGKGRPNPARPIPNALRLGPKGSVAGADFGSSGRMKLFALPSGIYYRQGKPYDAQRKHQTKGGYRKKMGVRNPRRLIMLRSLAKSSQTVRATHWHTDAMRMWGTWAQMSKAYSHSARRIIGGDIVAS